jgi:hypothetical protein
VQVYEIGSYEGRPFLALEYIEGGSLASRLDGKPWPPGEAAALLETLASAIDVAHGEVIVHRDLKPANIILQEETTKHTKHTKEDTEEIEIAESKQVLPSSGSSLSPSSFRVFRVFRGLTPKITDFGLAQTLEDGQTMTQSGILVGTPGYMAPEQASGKRALVGPATDIYALGVVLYQLLTGQLPFQANSTLELLRAVVSEEPPRPRRLQPRLPRDLEAITLHCLEKEPGQRYPTALALAEDLQRFRERKQVVARPVGTVARLARACRRRPVIALLIALLALSLFGGLGGVAWEWREANKQRDLANARARQADDEKQAALYQTYRASLAAASTAVASHDMIDAAQHLQLAPEALRGWEWRYLSNRLDDSASVVPLPHKGGGFLIPGPDRLRIGVLASDGLRITDLDGGKHGTVPLALKQGVLVNAIQTRCGLRVAVWVDATTIDVFDDAGQVVCRVTRPDCTDHEPGPVAVSTDGTRLACWIGNRRKELAVFDAICGKPIAICKGHFGGMYGYAFSPDGTRLVTGNEDGTARVWDAASGTLQVICRHPSTVQWATFSPDGTRLVTASGGRCGSGTPGRAR